MPRFGSSFSRLGKSIGLVRKLNKKEVPSRKNEIISEKILTLEKLKNHIENESDFEVIFPLCDPTARLSLHDDPALRKKAKEAMAKLLVKIPRYEDLDFLKSTELVYILAPLMSIDLPDELKLRHIIPLLKKQIGSHTWTDRTEKGAVQRTEGFISRRGGSDIKEVNLFSHMIPLTDHNDPELRRKALEEINHTLDHFYKIDFPDAERRVLVSGLRNSCLSPVKKPKPGKILKRKLKWILMI